MSRRGGDVVFRGYSIMKAENPCLIVYTIFNHLYDDTRSNILLAMITIFLVVQLCSLLERL